MARIVGFHVEGVDVAPERATAPDLDLAAVTPWTYVVIITQTHVTDEQTLRQVPGTAAAYVGMIGSRRKVRTIFDHLRADGVAGEQLARVCAPIGLDLGGRSPAEIALAILAEIVQLRYDGTGRPRALSKQDSSGIVGLDDALNQLYLLGRPPERVVEFDFPPCADCGGCTYAETNEEDCYGNPFPVCGDCLWARGIIRCP